MFLFKFSLVALLLVSHFISGMDAQLRKIERQREEAQRKIKADYDKQRKEAAAHAKKEKEELAKQQAEERAQMQAKRAAFEQESIEQRNRIAQRAEAFKAYDSEIKQITVERMALSKKLIAGEKVDPNDIAALEKRTQEAQARYQGE